VGERISECRPVCVWDLLLEGRPDRELKQLSQVMKAGSKAPIVERNTPTVQSPDALSVGLKILFITRLKPSVLKETARCIHVFE
jgi:hypothetical protein